MRVRTESGVCSDIMDLMIQANMDILNGKSLKETKEKYSELVRKERWDIDKKAT